MICQAGSHSLNTSGQAVCVLTLNLPSTQPIAATYGGDGNYVSATSSYSQSATKAATRLDNSGYPTTDQGLQALVSRPATSPVPRQWNPNGYLERVPLDPWGRPYVYLSDGARFTLKSYGADGVEGGEGKFADIDSRD